MLRPDFPEIWGGLECTINRVGDCFKDQLELSGHYRRADDIAMISKLGFKRLRYPILWERHQCPPAENINWNFTAARLNEIVACGMTPIAGLLHHGSGPVGTSLLDPAFPQKFAEYAKQVATAFPWIKYYTPVNEPLTTARFSGLYGFWYPHKKSCNDFLQMLVNQLKGVVLAMKEIRRVNPAAQLIQTEDLAKVHSTPSLKYQADFENQRRWLTFDLLCGKVDHQHPLWYYMTSNGVKESQLQFFISNPCPPDVLGLNYYVTSERWLDQDTSKYPPHTHGGNGFHRYADTEAVRASPNRMQGAKVLIEEAWDRFHIPVAITEAHINCTREEQLRWLHELWTACCQLKRKGADILALTAWSVLGSFDWDSLLTESRGHYEPGLFDVRAGSPRPIATAAFVKKVSKGIERPHPLVRQPGWWQSQAKSVFSNSDHPPVLIIGKTGTLGTAFTKICESRSIPYRALSRAECDIQRPNEINRVIEKYRPWAIINASGFVRVDEAEESKALCFRINADGPARLAVACNANGIKLLNFSSDLVFNGRQSIPYIETDRPDPINVYGESKVAGERAVLGANNHALIVRSSTFFGPWDQYNFIHDIVKRLAAEGQIEMASDMHISPTYVPDLVNAALDLLIDDASGIWHIVNEGQTTWAEVAAEVAERAGFQRSQVVAVPAASLFTPAKRPVYSVLSSNQGGLLRPLPAALDAFMHEQKRNDPSVASIWKYFQHEKNN